jgi:hypothetical protein
VATVPPKRALLARPTRRGVLEVSGEGRPQPARRAGSTAPPAGRTKAWRRKKRIEAGSVALFAEIDQIVGADRQALVLKRVENEGAHRHVGLVSQASELLAQFLAEAE